MNSGKKKYRLQGKTSAHTKSLVKSQVLELCRRGQIKTTPSKAKVLKSQVDRLMAKAKSERPAAAQQLMKFWGNDKRGMARFMQVADSLDDRSGGYTRIAKTLPRDGDNAEQVFIAFVESEKISAAKKSTIKKTLEKQQSSKKRKKKES